MSKKKVLLRGVFINRDTNGEGVLKVGTTLIRVSTVTGILYEVVLKKENEKWIVYVTDERASKITNSVDKYNTETEAIEDFIERLRADKVLCEL